MKNLTKFVLILLAAVCLGSALCLVSFATDAETNAPAVTEAGTEAEAAAADPTSSKALAATIIIAVAAGAGALSMALAISKAVGGISRQPEAGEQIRSTLMLGLVFIETAIIYALIVAILVIFVL